MSRMRRILVSCHCRHTDTIAQVPQTSVAVARIVASAIAQQSDLATNFALWAFRRHLLAGSWSDVRIPKVRVDGWLGSGRRWRADTHATTTMAICSHPTDARVVLPHPQAAFSPQVKARIRRRRGWDIKNVYAVSAVPVATRPIADGVTHAIAQ